METILSYSLKDLLLFSRETWSVLYIEFAQLFWVLPILACVLYCLSLLFANVRPELGRPFNLITQWFLLGSCLNYYWTFYKDINQHAAVFAGLVALQMLMLLYKYPMRKGARESAIFHVSARPGKWHKYLWVLLVPATCTFVFFEHQNSDFGEWLLPGWHAGVSLLLIIHLQLLNSERWRLAIPILLVLIESTTLYLIDYKLWWLLLALPCLMLIALALDKKAQSKNIIQELDN